MNPSGVRRMAFPEGTGADRAMKPRLVLLINPNTSSATTATMHRLARAALPADFVLESATARRGAPMITSDSEMATAIEEVVAIGCGHVAEVCAVVVAAFGNPGVDRLRARLAMPVVGIGEASMREAAAGRRRFGVATTTPGLEASIAGSADRLGLASFFSGSRFAAGGPLRLAGAPALQDERLAEAIQACIELDGAEAVVIGGGPLAESGERIGPRFAVPVISPIAAAMREVAAALRGAARSP
jgi:allantoin racemase